MVIRAMLLILALASALLAAGETPKARKIIPPAADLPGDWKHPWEIGGEIRRYKTESEWRKENSPPLNALPQLDMQLAMIPDDQWREARERMIQMRDQLGLATASLSPVQRAFLEAVLEHGTKEAVKEAVAKAYRDVTDADVMEYVRVVNPASLPGALSGEEEDEGKVTGAATLSFELQIMTVESVTERASDIDLSREEFDGMVAESQAGLDRMLGHLVRERTKSLELDLAWAYMAEEPEQERVDEILTELSALGDVRIDVDATRPLFGNSAYVVLMTRPEFPGEPVALTGHAMVRRGVAVWRLRFEVMGDFVAGFPGDLKEILTLLVERSKPYDLEEMED